MAINGRLSGGLDRERQRPGLRRARGAVCDAYLEAFNLLPNLQLLAGTANSEKLAMLPADWIGSSKVFPSEEKRKTYIEENDLDGMPLDLPEFLEFFNSRRTRIRKRLVKALDFTAPQTAEDQGTA